MISGGNLCADNRVTEEKQESWVRKECACHQRIQFSIDGHIGAWPSHVNPGDEYIGQLRDHQEVFIWGKHTFPWGISYAACGRILSCSCVPGQPRNIDLGHPCWLISHLGLRFGLLNYPHATTCLLQDGGHCRSGNTVCGHVGIMYRSIMDLKTNMFSTLTGL